MRKKFFTVFALLSALTISACQDTDPSTTTPTEPAFQQRNRTTGPSQISEGGPAVGLKLVADGLTNPVHLTEAPDGSGRLFIVDQIGLIRVLMPDGTLLPEPFLDLRAQIVNLNPFFDERGLLGLAFHPSYASNGRFFVYYSAPEILEAGFNHTTHVSEFSVSADPNRADPASEQILLRVPQPQFNHNAGMLAFGPEDGFLYISLGDGGGAHDVGLGHVEDWYAENAGGNGQDITQNLLGSILRIDVDAGIPYGIPADNPFVGSAGLDEIYAYGFRNPFRFSFDMGGSHMLLAGDAGQNLWEEVSVVEKGGNYGWNVKEGTHCFDAEAPLTIPGDCPDVDPTTGISLTDPVIEFPTLSNPFVAGVGNVVIGGYVYRGDRLPQLRGDYIFGTFTTESGALAGAVFLSKPRKQGLWHIQRLHFPNSTPDGELGHFVLAFGQDLEGEVYVLTTDTVGPSGETGKVFMLISPSGKDKGPKGR